MFRHEGPGRTERQNRILASYLAFVGGYVNSAGFVLIGAFTSHVTGNVGRMANDLASRDIPGAAAGFTMIFAFFAGAVLATLIIESALLGERQNAYGVALSGEAALLVAFTALPSVSRLVHPRWADADAAILCAAMGMQNALVTRLSGAVVRTTHLTGVITDLGIEAGRWVRWWLSAGRAMTGAGAGQARPERPSNVKVALLSTIAGAFTLGAIAGASASLLIGRAAELIPALGVGACAAYAFLSREVVT